MESISILGCGWLGMKLGKFLSDLGHPVAGSTTNEDKLSEIADNGMKPYLIDLKESVKTRDFFAAKCLVVTIPPRNPENGVSCLALLDQLLHVVQPETRILFVSSTGVYPNLNRVVTESDADVIMKSRAGIPLLEAEKKFSSATNTIVRFGGLIDERRNPGFWFAGKSGLEGGHVPVNLVHLDDCIGAIHTIITQQLWGQTFNVCSPEHPTRAAYYSGMSRKLNMEPPVLDRQETEDWKEVSSQYFQDTSGYSFQRSIWEL